MAEILGNDNIVKGLVFHTPDFLQKTIPADFDKTKLIYDKLWPFKFVPNIQDKPATLITTHFSFRPYRDGTSFKLGDIIFYVITHKTLMSCDTGLRTDILISEIDQIFNRSSIYGVGGFAFDGMEDFLVDSGGTLVGTSIGYRGLEFA